MPSHIASFASGRIKWQPTLPQGLAVLLCAAITALIVREGLNTLRLGQSNHADAEIIATSTVARAQPARVVPDTGAMIARHLFGRTPPEPVVVEEVVDAPIPETTLALQLVGVFTHTNPDQASAIIADDRGAGKTYRVGDRIDTRTQLQAVTRDSVILQTAGVKEQLYFAHVKRPDVDASLRMATAQRAVTGDSRRSRRETRAVVAATAQPSSVPLSNQQIRASMQAKLKQWREQVANNAEGHALSAVRTTGT